MNEVESLLQNNATFAAQQQAAGTLMPSLPETLPFVRAIVIGCADMRVDPAHMLGLKLGEAVVMRNIGGRVTPGILRQLELLGRIGQVAAATPGGGGEFNVIVLHHTDCGITRLKNDAVLLKDYFEVPETEVASKALADPRESVKVDVAVLSGVEALPASWLLSGLVYDVHTGRVELVVPPAPFRAA
ncbi:MAG: carbonic anhydrase [Janthinobacterium lividum]